MTRILGVSTYDHFTPDQDAILFTAVLQALVIFKDSEVVLNNL